jgi:hypothetical protein
MSMKVTDAFYRESMIGEDKERELNYLDIIKTSNDNTFYLIEQFFNFGLFNRSFSIALFCATVFSI